MQNKSDTEQKEIKFRDLNDFGVAGSGLKYASMERFDGEWRYPLSPKEKQNQDKANSLLTLFAIAIFVIISMLL